MTTSHFLCTLCDDPDTGRPTQFDSFDATANHVRLEHKVTVVEFINRAIKLPPLRELVSYRCALCLEPVEAYTLDKLLKDHFQKDHHTKKVKASQVRRTCRICGHDKARTEKELHAHIAEEHPLDRFADDEEEEILEIDGDDYIEPKTSVKDELEKSFAQALAEVQQQDQKAAVAKTEDDDAVLLLTTTAAQSVALPKAATKLHNRHRKVAHSTSTSSSEDDSSDSSSSSSSSSGADRRKAKKRRRKREKKRRKKKKKRSKSQDVKKRVHDNDDDDDDDDDDVVDEEEDVDEIEKILDLASKEKATSSPPATGMVTNSCARSVISEKDISFFNKLRHQKEPPPSKAREQRADSLSDGEIRDQPVPSKPMSDPQEMCKGKIKINLIAADNDDMLVLDKRIEEKEPIASPMPPLKSQERTVIIQEVRKVVRKSPVFSSEDEMKRDATKHQVSLPPPVPPLKSSNFKQHYCIDCAEYFTDSTAYDHFSGKTHRLKTKYKIRCYLCSKYVDSPKQHLEKYHVQDVFQCRGQACSQPKFLDLVKIVNHIVDKHSVEYRRLSNDELIRRNMVAVPVNLFTYKCKLCNRQFVAQPLSRVLQHQLWEHNIETPSERDVIYMCRICGGKRTFPNNEELTRHIAEHRRNYSRSPQSPTGRRFSGGGRRPRSNSYGCSSRSSSVSPLRNRRRSPPQQQHKPQRKYVRCSFCPQVTEDSEGDRRSHLNYNHGAVLFKCKLCANGDQVGSQYTRGFSRFHV